MDAIAVITTDPSANKVIKTLKSLDIEVPEALDLSKLQAFAASKLAEVYAQWKVEESSKEVNAEIKKLKSENKEYKSILSDKEKKDAEATQVKALKSQMEDVIKRATKINEEYAALKTEDERRALIKSFEEQIGQTGLVTDNFTLTNSNGEFLPAPIPQASDLPVSEIISNLPVRVMEQQLVNTLQNYSLGSLATVTTVRNGLAQIFYGDYADADSKKAYTDVVLADFNGETTPAGTENYSVDTDIHSSYKVLDAMLNDVTISMGLFLSIVSSAVNGYVKPIAKKMYQRIITFLDTQASYDEVITFSQGADSKKKAKELHNKIFSLQTTSRSHLKKIPNGLTKALEYKLQTGNARLILNKDYASNYRYDVTANTFTLGEITYNVKQIIVLDFDLLDEYSEGSTDFLKGCEVILFEDGVYHEIRHYQGSKQTQTPKLYSIFHYYTRVGNYRRKDKILLAFKNHA